MTIKELCSALIGGHKLSRTKAVSCVFLLVSGLLFGATSHAQLTVDRASGAITFELANSAEVQGYTISSPNGLLSPDTWNSLSDQEVDGWIEANPQSLFLSELNPYGFIDPSASQLNLGNAYSGTTVDPSKEDLAVQYILTDGSVVDGAVNFVGPINDFVLRVDPESGAASIESLSSNVGPFDITSYTISSPSGALNAEGFGGIPGDAWTKAGLSANAVSQLSYQSSQSFENSTIDIGSLFTPGADQDLTFEYGIVGSSKALVGTVTYGENTGGGNGGGDPTSCEAIAASRIAGDADGSGDVGFLDFLALANNFGTEAGYDGGNFDCMGTVSFLDFLTLANNFGASAAETASVPEPSSAPVMFVAAVCLMGVYRKRLGSAALMGVFGLAFLASVGTGDAMAVDFNTRMILLDADNPGANPNINSALEARGIFNGTVTDVNIAEDVSSTVDFIDFAGGGGAFGNFDYPYPNGVNDATLDDFAVQVTGFLEIPEGTWYIGLNSDDGGYISMPRVNFTNTVNENGPTGAVGELMFNGTRGQGTFTYGEFTVPAGGIRTEFEALMFERGGGDSFEVAVLDDEFPIESNEDWASFAIELGDETYDWRLIEEGPATGDFNWDDSVDFEDFLVLAANFNTGTSFAQGDINGDGQVNLVDFGAFIPLLPPQAATASSVPEPNSVSLLAFGLFGTLCVRRRTNRRRRNRQ